MKVSIATYLSVMPVREFLLCGYCTGQQHLLFGNYLSRPFLLLNLSVLRTFRQRGTPKWKKGEEQIKPGKNRHFLPLFPLRFPPLDSPFLNPLFPHLCRFLPASFPDTQEGADPYQPVAGNNSGAWLSTKTGSFPLYIRKCFTESKCCCPGYCIRLRRNLCAVLP